MEASWMTPLAHALVNCHGPALVAMSALLNARTVEPSTKTPVLAAAPGVGPVSIAQHAVTNVTMMVFQSLPLAHVGAQMVGTNLLVPNVAVSAKTEECSNLGIALANVLYLGKALTVKVALGNAKTAASLIPQRASAAALILGSALNAPNAAASAKMEDCCEKIATANARCRGLDQIAPSVTKPVITVASGMTIFVLVIVRSRGPEQTATSVS
jgi:hypothetical protein